MNSFVRLYALGIVWVGGGGFLFFAYPEVVCRLFRMKNPTPKRLRIMRITGAIELGLTFSSAVVVVIFGAP